MQKWMRWQDWLALLVGAYAALSPMWTETTNTATWTMVVLGAATVVVSLVSLYLPEDRNSEAAHALLGVLFFVAPWVMGFTDLTRMSQTAWIVGVITFAMGTWAFVETTRTHHVAPTH